MDFSWIKIPSDDAARSAVPAVETERGRPSNEELQDLIQRYTPNLMRASISLGFFDSDAEELVQDTFVAYLQGGRRFEGRSRLLTYLFGILYNKARESRRLRDREQATESIEEVFDQHFDSQGHWSADSKRSLSDPERHVEQLELGKALQHCLAGLNASLRMAFTMKEIEGLETPAICEAMQVTPTHLNVLLFRARNKLRECFSSHGTNVPQSA